MLDSGRTVFAAGLDRGPLRELFLLTAKPFIYVFNCDSDELADEELKERMRALVAPAEAIFLDAKIESELVEMEPDEAREFLAEMGIDEPGSRRAGPGRLRHPRPADLPDRRAQGVAGLDDPARAPPRPRPPG